MANVLKAVGEGGRIKNGLAILENQNVGDKANCYLK